MFNVPDVQHAECSCHQIQEFFCLISFFLVSSLYLSKKLRSKGKKSHVGPVKANHFKFSYTHCFAWIQNLEACVAYSKA